MPSGVCERIQSEKRATNPDDLLNAESPGWGHFSAVEKPDVVAGALVDLMARVLASEGRE